MRIITDDFWLFLGDRWVGYVDTGRERRRVIASVRDGENVWLDGDPVPLPEEAVGPLLDRAGRSPTGRFTFQRALDHGSSLGVETRTGTMFGRTERLVHRKNPGGSWPDGSWVGCGRQYEQLSEYTPRQTTATLRIGDFIYAAAAGDDTPAVPVSVAAGHGELVAWAAAEYAAVRNVRPRPSPEALHALLAAVSSGRLDPEAAVLADDLAHRLLVQSGQ